MTLTNIYILFCRGIQAATGKRAAVVTRGTYPSSGKYAGHWLGDNAAIWPHLRYSIIGILEFNLFGVPFVSATIIQYQVFYSFVFGDVDINVSIVVFNLKKSNNILLFRSIAAREQ